MRPCPGVGNGLLLTVCPFSPPSPPLSHGEISKPSTLPPLPPPLDSLRFSSTSAQHHEVTSVQGNNPAPQLPPPWQEKVTPCARSYLRCDVVRSSTEGGGCDTVQNPFLAHPEVGQLAVTFCIQKDVVQFQIPARWPRPTRLMLQPSHEGLLE